MNAEDDRLKAIQNEESSSTSHFYHNNMVDSNMPIEGITMGLDDIYEDSYTGNGFSNRQKGGRDRYGNYNSNNKYHTNKYRGNVPWQQQQSQQSEWFGTYFHKNNNNIEGNNSNGRTQRTSDSNSNGNESRRGKNDSSVKDASLDDCCDNIAKVRKFR